MVLPIHGLQDIREAVPPGCQHRAGPRTCALTCQPDPIGAEPRPTYQVTITAPAQAAQAPRPSVSEIKALAAEHAYHTIRQARRTEPHASGKDPGKGLVLAGPFIWTSSRDQRLGSLSSALFRSPLRSPPARNRRPARALAAK